MARTYDPQVRALEAALDAEYSSTVPKTRSWELSVSHLLLAHALGATGNVVQEFYRPPPGPWSPSVESRKHGAMNAVRMLHKLESRPIPGIRTHVDEGLLHWAVPFLSLGEEYDAVICGFTHYHEGRFEVAELGHDRLVFEPNDVSEVAYDIADHYIHAHEPNMEASLEFAKLARAAMHPSGTITLSKLMASPSMTKALFSSMTSMIAEQWQLPDQWSFRGVSISSLRRFWTALMVLGNLGLVSGFKIMEATKPTWGPVLWVQLPRLVSCIAQLADLGDGEVRRAMEWHIYDRTNRKSDIALAPFVATGPDHLIASPEMIATSRIERNFYANAARISSSEIDAQSNLLAPHMASNLATGFRGRGFQVATSIPYKSSRGSGDIDLLVWAPQEKAVMALELKWFVAAADYREVLNQATKAGDALRKQLPKYRCALSEDMQGLLRRAFGAESASTPNVASVGLVMRNCVGHASLRRYEGWFAPEGALLDAMMSSQTLVGIIDGMSKFTWLPRPQKDYVVDVKRILSPKGISLGVPGYRVLKGEPV